MKIRLKTFIGSTVVWLSLLSSVIVTGYPSAALGGITGFSSDDSFNTLNRGADRMKILSVLENRIGSQKSLEKVKDKLLHLSDGEARLIASLSDLAANEGNRAGAEIAFLLLTALIVLS